MSTIDALDFLDAVKRCYADRPQVYQSFLDIMKDFKTQRYLPPLAGDCDLFISVFECRTYNARRLDTPGVIAAVRELFGGNEELIEGFNVFLPPGYHVPLAANTPSNSVPEPTPPLPQPAAMTAAVPPLHQARNFVTQVKARTTPGQHTCAATLQN